MDYKKNTIQLDLASYRHYWRGQAKVGKTSLFRDLVVELYGDAKYGLLLSIGQEIGYKALDNLYAHDCPEWVDLVEVVDDLTDNKKSNEFKILAIDTVDELIELAEKEVLAIHRREKSTDATSINAALGGYGAGKKKARSLVENIISKLERAGYGMIYVSHVKVKDITEKATDVAYQQLTGALEFSYDAIFSDRADVMAMFVTESETKDERLKSSKRYIYFRSTNFIDAGSRLSNLPEKIELNAKNYISAINSALETSSGVSGKDAVKARKQEEKIREEKADSMIEEKKAVESFRKEVLSFAKGLSPEVIKVKKEELLGKGLPVKFADVEDMKVLKSIHEVLTS